MPALVRRVRVGVSTSVELVRAMWNGPYWWLVPVMCVLLPAAIVFIVLQAVPVVAPFVYTLF
ncbi:MAG TPA: DUF5989 family protein [Planctomycetota bacterium]|nr:DUF5989 family protein [Planctomycetota bacterium]